MFHILSTPGTVYVQFFGMIIARYDKYSYKNGVEAGGRNNNNNCEV